MDFNLSVAARTLYGEARGEPLEGQKAVAHVLLNRLKSRRWGDHLFSVCTASKQFSAWNKGDPNLPKMLALDDQALQPFLAVLEAARTGEDPTGGALHYYATSMPQPPYWADSMKESARIGRHVFLVEK